MTVHSVQSALLAAFVCWGILVGFVAAPTAAGEKETKAVTQEDVNAAIAAKKWQEAKALIQKLSASAPKEDAARLSATLKRVQGELDLDAFDADLAKVKKGWRKQRQKLEELGKKYQGVTELEPRVAELSKKIRTSSCLTLDEIDNPEVEIIIVGGGVQEVTDPKLVKDGKSAMRFLCVTEDGFETYVWLSPKGATDWTSYDALGVWIFAEEKCGSVTLLVGPEAPDTSFAYEIDINWLGWKELVLPLKAQAGGFTARGKPSWKQIDRVEMWNEKQKRLAIVVDDLHLEKM